MDQLVAHAVDSDGNPLAGRVLTWTSSDEEVVTVDPDGVATGVELGSATITAELDGHSAAIDVSVVHRFVSITTRWIHTCALNAAGDAWCWGDSRESRTPVRVGAGLDLAFVSLTAGAHFTCGLTAAGDVWCWGDNEYFQLGKGNEQLPRSSEPVLVDGVAFTAVWAMEDGVCGLDYAGLAHCWGNDWEGGFVLGDPENTAPSPDPLPVSAPSEGEEPLAFVELRPGGFFTCGLTESSLLYCWGYNWYGALGDGSRESRARPVQPLPGEPVLAFGSGMEHACAVKADRTTWCWGNNNFGPVSSDDRLGVVPEPMLRFVAEEFVPVDFALGDEHSCALDAGGEVRCWGDGWFGRLGRAYLEPYGGPEPIDGGLSFVTIAAGVHHNCGIAIDEKVYCWGRGSSGRLGTGSSDDTFEPLPVYGQ